MMVPLYSVGAPFPIVPIQWEGVLGRKVGLDMLEDNETFIATDGGPTGHTRRGARGVVGR